MRIQLVDVRAQAKFQETQFQINQLKSSEKLNRLIDIYSDTLDQNNLVELFAEQKDYHSNGSLLHSKYNLLQDYIEEILKSGRGHTQITTFLNTYNDEVSEASIGRNRIILAIFLFVLLIVFSSVASRSKGETKAWLVAGAIVSGISGAFCGGYGCIENYQSTKVERERAAIKQSLRELPPIPKLTDIEKQSLVPHSLVTTTSKPPTASVEGTNRDKSFT